jgi:hypothetical protein
VTKESLGVGVNGLGEVGGPCMGRRRKSEGGMCVEVRFKKVVNGGSCAKVEKDGSGL